MLRPPGILACCGLLLKEWPCKIAGSHNRKHGSDNLLDNALLQKFAKLQQTEVVPLQSLKSAPELPRGYAALVRTNWMESPRRPSSVASRFRPMACTERRRPSVAHWPSRV